MLRQLQRDELVDDLIGHYVDIHKQQANALDLAAYPLGGSVEDAILRRRLAEAHVEFAKRPTLSGAVRSIVESNSYD